MPSEALQHCGDERFLLMKNVYFRTTGLLAHCASHGRYRMTQLAKLRRFFSPTVLSMVGLLVVATAARIPLFPQVAYMAPNPVAFSDAGVWELWSRTLWEHGLDDLSLIEPKTYLGYHYVFWAVGQVYGLISPDFELGTKSLLYLIKVPPVIFDLLLMVLIFMATRRAAALLPEGLAAARRLPPVRALERRGLAPEDSLGLAAAAIFALSPAVIYDSAVWAQSESVITFFMLAAILALATGRVGPAWALWAIGFVVKPQPIVIVPALVAFTFWRFGWRGLIQGALGAGLGAFGMLAYFVATGNGPYILEVYQELFQTHDQHISINAWNLWWFGQQLNGLRASDVLLPLGPIDLTVEGASFLLLVLTTLLTLAYLHVRRDLIGLLVACAMLHFAFYLFPISTHERYLYPLFAFLAPLLLLERRWLILFVPLSAIFFLNIFFASPSDPDISKAALNSDFGLAMAGVNVALFVVTAAALLVYTIRARPWSHPLRVGPTPSQEPAVY